MITRYNTERPKMLAPGYENSLVLSEKFDRFPFDTLLGKTSCAGLRLYYGMDENLVVSIIAVAVNQNGDDILPGTAAESTSADDGHIVERGLPCPPYCPAIGLNP